MLPFFVADCVDEAQYFSVFIEAFMNPHVFQTVTYL